MKRFYIYLLLILAVVSCGKDKPVTPDPDLESGAEQVTLVYFMGTNLKSYYNVNVSDLKKSVASGSLGSGGRLLYLLPSTYYTATLYELKLVDEECEVVEVEVYSELNTLNSSSMQQVIEDVKTAVGFDEDDMTMNMIFSGHGTGWVLQDHPNMKSMAGESSSSEVSMWEQYVGEYVTRFMGCSVDGYMDIDDIRVGIESSDTKFGYILFDACFMSSIEALYRLRECSDYIVASPSEVMGDGFPYQEVFPYLSTDDGRSYDLQGVCEVYYYHYKTYASSLNSGCVAMCVTSELEALADAMSIMSFDDVDASSLQIYEGLSDHVFYDLGQFVNVAAANDANLDAFNKQFDLAFPEECRLHTDQFYTVYSERMTDINYYSGVTTSDPSIKFREDWALEPWVIDSGRYISVE